MNSTSSPISATQRALDTEPQSIDAPLSTAAAFLILVIMDDDSSIATARSVVGSTDDLVKDVRIRTEGGVFTCNVGISHRVWGPLTGKPAPSELAPFKEVRGAKHTAVATEGDLLYHIRAESMGVIIEFEKLLLEAFGDSVTAIDDVAGFRYFDGATCWSSSTAPRIPMAWTCPPRRSWATKIRPIPAAAML